MPSKQIVPFGAAVALALACAAASRSPSRVRLAPRLARDSGSSRGPQGPAQAFLSRRSDLA